MLIISACSFPIEFFLINAIIALTTEYWCLQGRVKFPTGGKVRERASADLVRFQNRQ